MTKQVPGLLFRPHGNQVSSRRICWWNGEKWDWRKITTVALLGAHVPPNEHQSCTRVAIQDRNGAKLDWMLMVSFSAFPSIDVDVQYRFTVTRAEEEDPYSSILAKLFTGEWRFPSTSRVPTPELEPEPGPESLIHKYVPSTTAFGIVGKTVLKCRRRSITREQGAGCRVQRKSEEQRSGGIREEKSEKMTRPSGIFMDRSRRALRKLPSRPSDRFGTFH
ncbi:hypothetical protein KQX54_007236 [Cotesia glomerata]|uniref:Uncharacterized protein n=1 Tax=Cotesia glomerata TaxID=32391 RepID=A0AAV7I6E7_COTGL|nr:hypothetical protein KQX54_007236 [Cotesia glomerata]